MERVSVTGSLLYHGRMGMGSAAPAPNISPSCRRFQV